MELTEQEKIEVKGTVDAVRDGIAKANEFESWDELKNWGNGSFRKAMDIRVKSIVKKLIEHECIL